MAKQKYRDLVCELFETDDEEKERKLEFIVDFLKNANFSKLRAQGFDEEDIGDGEKLVRITKEGDEYKVKEVNE